MALWRYLILLGLCGLLALQPAPVNAHANLTRSEPLANARLTEAPSEIRLWFSEPLQPQFSRILVRDSDGSLLSLSDTVFDTSDPTYMSVSSGGLADGLYTVSWRAVSASDGHSTEGSFSFGINVIVTSPNTALEEAPVALASVLVNAFHLMSASVTVGSLAFVLFVWRGTGRSEHRLQSLTLLGWVSWVAALLCVLVAQTARNSGASLFDAPFNSGLIDTLSMTRFGMLWLVRFGLWLVTGICLWLLPKRPGLAWLAFVLGAGVLSLHSLFGHASGVEDAGVAVAANALHLLLTALWVGGLVAFLVSLMPLPRAIDAAQTTGVLVARFSNYARITVVGLALTGVYAAWLHVGSFSALIGTFYGRALLFKTLLFLPLLAIAGINLIWTAHQLNAGVFRWVGRLRGLVGAEIALLAAVLVAAAVLTSGSPARATEALRAANAAQPALDPYFGMEIVNDQMIHLEIIPGTVGENEFIVTLFDEAGAAITDASLIRMRLENRDQDIGRSEIRPQLAEDGSYRINATNLSLPGEWRIRLNIQRPGQFDMVTDFEVSVSAATPASAASVQAIPFTERVAAAGLMGICLVMASGYMLAQERQTKRAGSLLVSSASLMVGILAVTYAGSLLAMGTTLSVADAWARPTARDSDAALYMTISNMTASEQQLVSVEASMAASAHIHQTQVTDDVARMQENIEISIAPLSQFVLEPGGYHLMLDSVMQEFVAGDTFSITLTFASGMMLTVPVTVRDE